MEIDYENMILVSVKDIKEVINKLHLQQPEVPEDELVMSIEFFLMAAFPGLLDNLKENMFQQYKQGYEDGYKASKNDETTEGV